MRKMSHVRILIPTGFGLNCEAESEWAWKRLGCTVNRVHLGDLFGDPTPIREAHLIMLIGGFAYGDHVASGRVLATRLNHRLGKPIAEHIAAGKLVLGVCNGFQTMVKMGLLPGLEPGRRQRVSLAVNEPAKFRDAWVHLTVDDGSPCIYTKGIKRLSLPIRHGEGRFAAESDDLMSQLMAQRLVPLYYADPLSGTPTEQYPANPNGSPFGIAGLCDPTGRIFGLMPHPEAYLTATQHPLWTRFAAGGFFDPDADGDGVTIFRNAAEFIHDNLL